jgi:hypothetical protein
MNDFRARRTHSGSSDLRLEPLEARRLLANAAFDALPADLQELADHPLAAEARQRVGVDDVTVASSLATQEVAADAANALDSVSYWTAQDEASLTAEATTTAAAFSVVAADVVQLASELDGSTIFLPTPHGGAAKFAVERYDLLSPTESAPQLHAVRLRGIDDPAASGRGLLTGTGFDATILSPDGNWRVEPLDGRTAGPLHVSFFRAHVPLTPAHPDDFVHDHDHDDHDHEAVDTPIAKAVSVDNTIESLPYSFGENRKIFRLAVATTGEWTNQAGSANAAFNRLATQVNNVNAIFSREFNIELQLASTTATIYTNANSDPFTNGDRGAMINQVQGVLDSAYGCSGYDVGHVLGTGGGGRAQVGSVGVNGSKGRAVTNYGPFDSRLVLTFAHELGHQFGSRHTFNFVGTQFADQRAADFAYEPGSGSTIMSYGGLGLSGDFVFVRDDYFHTKSIDRIDSLTSSGAAGVAAVLEPTGNTAPVPFVPPSRTIPANTPFLLEGSATDSDGDTLTFNWEQYDLGDDDPLGVDDGNGPLFRSREPDFSSSRSFPELPDVLANREDDDEVLPQVARLFDPLTFRMTVRDGVGGVAADVVDLPVVDTGAAFRVLTGNSGGAVARGSDLSVAWDVAGTDANGIDVAEIRIDISYNNGNDWTSLATTDNDGQHVVTVPTDAPLNFQTRLRVAAVDNYFYDVSDGPIGVVNEIVVEPNLPTSVTAGAGTFLYGDESGMIFDVDLDVAAGGSPVIGPDAATYRFASPQAGLVRIFANDFDPSVDVQPVLGLYDESGVYLQGSTGSGDQASLARNVEAGEVFHVVVSSDDLTTPATLDLEIRTLDNGATQTLSFGSPGVAGTLSELDTQEEVRFFDFVAPDDAAGTGTVRVSPLGFDSVVALFDGDFTGFDGNLLAFADAEAGADQLSFDGFVPGQRYVVRVGSSEFRGGADRFGLAVNLDLAAPTEPPSRPDLLPAGDTGLFDDDDLTRQETDLPIRVSAQAGEVVRLFRESPGGNVEVGTQAAESDGTATFLVSRPAGATSSTYFATTGLAVDGEFSAAGPSLTILFDTIAPAAPRPLFVFDRAAMPDGSSGDQRFSLPSAEQLTIDAAAITVLDLATQQAVPGFEIVADAAGTQLAVVFDPTVGVDRLPDGNYGLRIPATAIRDVAGNAATADVTFDTFALDGDANRDRAVNLADFGVLRGNFGASGGFRQGDFNNDGVINLADFGILRGNFGTTLTPPASLFADDADQFATAAATTSSR